MSEEELKPCILCEHEKSLAADRCSFYKICKEYGCNMFEVNTRPQPPAEGSEWTAAARVLFLASNDPEVLITAGNDACDRIDRLTAENQALKTVMAGWVESEAAHCPEDVGFVEYIKTLTAQLNTAQERNGESEESLRTYGEHTTDCDHVRLTTTYQYVECNCGFEQALKPAEGKQDGSG